MDDVDDVFDRRAAASQVHKRQRAQSPAGFSQIKDEASGKFVLARKMSDNALTNFNPGATSDTVQLRNQEFQVISNDDIKGFVDGVEARSQAQSQRLLGQMEAEMNFNQEQTDFFRRHYEQQAQQIVDYVLPKTV